MNDIPQAVELPRLGEMGLANFAPYLMNRIMGRYNQALRAELADLGLTTAQSRALATLSVVDGPLIRELSVLTVTEQSTLSRALDQLAAQSMVRREADTTDSRATRIFITDTGRAAVERLWPHMAQAQEGMFKGISPEERRAFVATLQLILGNIKKNDI